MTPRWLKFGFEAESRDTTPAWFQQVHGKKVVCLDDAEAGFKHPLPEADAGFTRTAGKSIHVFTADCVPVLLYGPTASDGVAAIHAGWRGALAGVVAQTIRSFGNPTYHAIVGPSIGVCCFEVKADFIQAFSDQGRDIEPYLQERQGRLFCDLLQFLREQEMPEAASVNVDSHRCTVCSKPSLPSYRRNGKADPRIRSFIAVSNA